MRAIIIVLMACIFLSAIELNSVQAGLFGIDWGNVSPKCTISCAGYWTCVFKGGNDCKMPDNCVCEKFA
uniref:Uncharacterized protein n=1 Tax=Panagrolaimus davidi TaxID=227884 RepID=A0A914Q5U2_9BILA